MSNLASLKHPNKQRMLGGREGYGEETGKKSREEKHDGAIGLQVLFYPEYDLLPLTHKRSQ